MEGAAPDTQGVALGFYVPSLSGWSAPFYLEFLHYESSPPPDADITWMTGDFNYDGKINVNDYLLFDAGYGHQSGTLSAEEEIAAWAPIPEPATLLLLASGALFGLRRRGRTR